MPNPKSTAQISGHPIHPMLIPFPIACWEVAKQAREIAPEFPIIYMTGAHADAYGWNGVPNSILLTKPFAPAQLVTAVSQLLNTGRPTT